MKISFSNFLNRLRVLLLIIASFLGSNKVWAVETIYHTDSRDSRIKTFLYSENEIYRVLLYHGFQSSIEFTLGEVPETISVGDSYAWKITPVDRRIFIKPQEQNIHTNMTVITNRRTYHFELLAKAAPDEVDPEFAYVVRFFYPSDK